MKKRILFFSALMIALFSFTAFDAAAQGQRGGGRQGGEITAESAAKQQSEMLTKSLELSDEQATEVYDVYLKIAEKNLPAMKEKMEEMKNSGGQRPAEGSERPERPNLFSESGDDATATDSQMKKILSDSQYEKWLEVKDNPPMGPEGLINPN